MVALAVGQAEQTFLQDGVLTVPKGHCEAEPLVVIGEARQPILAPPVGAGAGLVVAEVVPGIAAFAVVLADGSPLALAQVRPPLFPGGFLRARVVEADLFGGHETNYFRQAGTPSMYL